MLTSVELFAGVGGLGMGLELAGFKSQGVIEWDRQACETIKFNKERDFPLVRNWPLHHKDVRSFEYSSLPSGLDLVAGGPPCQPFSISGKHAAHQDSRDMFPAAVAVVRQLRPRAFIMENVKGLTRSSFANYYQYVLSQFEYPEVEPSELDDSWMDHAARLQKVKSSLYAKSYNVIPTLVNAANYGVPQKRERVFIVGFRSDLDIRWSFPPPTHSLEALLSDQLVSGRYWENHKLRAPAMTDEAARLSERLRKRNEPLATDPWVTVRDALKGMPLPTKSGIAGSFLNHRFQHGARSNTGHTGSKLDLPAKTLKAGDHGVPGGENMMVRDDGSVRYFTVRESARLQTFPDTYAFNGAWSEAMRQLGNAVPVTLASAVASSVSQKLIEHDMARLAVAGRA